MAKKIDWEAFAKAQLEEKALTCPKCGAELIHSVSCEDAMTSDRLQIDIAVWFECAECKWSTIMGDCSEITQTDLQEDYQAVQLARQPSSRVARKEKPKGKQEHHVSELKKESEALYEFIRTILKEDLSKYHPYKAALWISAKVGTPITPEVVEMIREWWVVKMGIHIRKWIAKGRNIDDPRVWSECLKDARDTLHIYLIFKDIPRGG